MFAPNAATVWADGPSSSPFQPDKSQIRAWGTKIENSLPALMIYPTSDGMVDIAVPSEIHSIRVDGKVFAGDGYDGIFVDEDNGSTITFDSADGRTWYRVDVARNDLRLSGGLLKVSRNLQTIPTSEDSSGMIVSFNRSDADGETNIRNMYVNPAGVSKAFVFSQITETGVSERDLLTMYRNGRVVVGLEGWLESLAAQAETVANLTALSRPGLAMGLIGAAKASHANAPAYFSPIGVWGFGWNDRARGVDFDHSFAAWAGYFEARRSPGSGRTHGVEIGTVNIDDGSDPCSLTTPYNYGHNNQLSGLYMSAGRPDFGAGQRDTDVAMMVIANGSPGHQVSYRAGLVFGADSVRYDGPTAPAIVMATQQGLRWHTSEGMRAYMHADQSSGAQTIGMVVRNSNIDFEYNDAVKLRMTSSGLRMLDTNAGFEGNANYIGNAAASRQFRLATFDESFPNLYLEANTGTVAAPLWQNRGQFNATTGVYSSVSDESLKQDFREFERDPFAVVAGLAASVSHYRMRSNSQEDHFGFRAHGVQSVLPEAVNAEGDILYVSDRPIAAVLALAVDRLNQRVTMLE